MQTATTTHKVLTYEVSISLHLSFLFFFSGKVVLLELLRPTVYPLSDSRLTSISIFFFKILTLFVLSNDRSMQHNLTRCIPIEDSVFMVYLAYRCRIKHTEFLYPLEASTKLLSRLQTALNKGTMSLSIWLLFFSISFTAASVLLLSPVVK